MPVDQARLLALAQAIADEREVDWEDAESTVHEADRQLVRELRLLAGVSEVHRSGARDDHASRAAADDENLSGQRWGSLEIRERIGAGSFGTVYRAWDERLARDVALKLLRREPSAADHGETLVHEGRLLAKVRHPNVITVFGAATVDGRAGLWMELIVGRSLEEFIRDHGPMGAREAALIGSDVCQALAAVHRAGLVHGDVKAQNVMREARGRTVLMDFGAGRDGRLPDDRNAVGTPAYAAPELFLGGRATPGSDMYSLGVLLFRLVTGEYPVKGRTSAEVREAHTRGRRQQLRDVRPDLPAAFVRIVERALAPTPSERFSSAGAMESALTDSLDSGGVTWVRESRDAASRRVRLGIAAAVAVAAVAFGIWQGRDWLTSVFAPPPHSIAALPFVNLSNVADEAYFVEGVSDVLLGRLMMLGRIRVLAPSSVAALPQNRRDPASLHQALGADYVLEGSVQRQDDRVRISARLVAASTGEVRWADTFERQLGDLFEISGELAGAIAASLGHRLTAAEGRRLQVPATTSRQAQEAYLRGRYLLYSFNRARLVDARAWFDQAVALDQQYAIAYASLARIHSMLLDFGLEPVGEARPAALAAATRAYSLNPDLPETNVALADASYRLNQDWAGADAAYQRALLLAPHASTVRSPYARHLAAAGRLDEALDQALAGQQSDPVLGRDVGDRRHHLLLHAPPRRGDALIRAVGGHRAAVWARLFRHGSRAFRSPGLSEGHRADTKGDHAGWRRSGLSGRARTQLGARRDAQLRRADRRPAAAHLRLQGRAARTREPGLRVRGSWRT